MNEISPEQLLSQIRSMGRELQTTGQTEPANATSFADKIKTSLNAVNESQQLSSDMQVGFLNETGEATLAEVMIASQKANLSFRAVSEVRNKLITAYQDIMNMPV